MSDPAVSVVIVSRGRPAALTRCLLGVSQLQYPRFEVVVVADPSGIAAAAKTQFASCLKLVHYDEPNISAARNLGVDHAAGEIIAFIDDDAVPEPQWLRHLTGPAAKRDVAAMGGFVRGRNGISFQWRARSLDALGEPERLEVKGAEPHVPTPPAGYAVKTEGTNMAIRREVLVALGGFDPAFHYYLDETDLNMRLAGAGHATAIAPLAEVHHGFAANCMRHRNRAPRDLFDIGASWAVFQRKHVPKSARFSQWCRLRDGQRRRLIRHLVVGTLEPREVRYLLERLDAGYEVGRNRPCGAPGLTSRPLSPFRPFPAPQREHVWLTANWLRSAAARRDAERLVRAGRIVTLLLLSRSALFHQVSFEAGGYWLQRGGVSGRAERDEPLLRWATSEQRAIQEHARITPQRGNGAW
ncbi:glycosyltransferase family 2 protein [Sulfitobacter aestuarii]|uniref:Glycosyltransferase family 2 protein n=1 Tax=Sulfitobacter aestuarii TaxID=2161676 RepID=A0ABW5TXJ7_9RHOB